MREDEIFEAALDIEDPAARSRFLADACGGDDGLRRGVERLLAIHEAGPPLFDRPVRGDPVEPWTGGGLTPIERLPDWQIEGITTLRLVGSGGFGRVYEGWQQAARRRVAVKVLREELTSPDAIARLGREARVLARLGHPGIAAVFAAGRTAEGTAYLVTEYVEGAVRLTDHARTARLDLPARVELLRQVCEAVGHAHARGIVHRDLKPGNILVDASGVPKVIDFGWACALEADVTRATTLTAPGQIVGTWQYMSPEQFAPDGSPATAASDVWSLGVVAWELFAGRPPHDLRGRPLPAIAAIVRTADPPLLTAVTPGIPKPLARIVDKCLQRSPAARYGSAGELAADLARLLAGEEVRARGPSFAAAILSLGRRYPLGSAILLGISFGVLVALGGLARSSSVSARAREAVEKALAETRREREEATSQRDVARRRLYASTLHRIAAAVERGDSPRAQALCDEAESLAAEVGASDGAGADSEPIELRLAAAEADLSLVSFTGHEGRVTDVACSPDGRLVASAGSDGTTRLWDAHTGVAVATLPDQGEPLRTVRFASDGRALVTVGNRGMIRLWDTASWNPRTPPGVQARSGVAVAFSPDSSRLAVGASDGSCRLWEVESGAVTAEMVGHRHPAIALAWSPDGATLVTAGEDRVLRAWNVADGTWLATERSFDTTVMAIGFSPDSATLVAGGRDGRLLLWPIRTGTPGRIVEAHEARIRCLAFSADGRQVATGAHDHTARLFDLETGEPMSAPLTHEAPVNAMLFVDGAAALVTATASGAICHWNPGTGRQMRCSLGHREAVTALAAVPGHGRFASAGADGTVRLWPAAGEDSGTLVASGTTPAVFAACEPGGREALVAWRDGAIASTDMLQLGGSRAIATPGGDWNAFAATPRLDRIVGGSERGTLRIVDRDPDHERTIRGAHTGAVASVAITPDGSRMASAARDGVACLWDADSGMRVATLAGSSGGRSGVAISPDGTLVAAEHSDGGVGLWTCADGGCLARLEAEGDIEAVGFGPSGTLVIATSAGTMAVWDPLRRERLATLEPPAGLARHIVFSPDGRLMAALHPVLSVTLWDTGNWRQVASLAAPDVRTGALAFSPDGARVALGCLDGTLRLWDARDGSELLVRKCHVRRVAGVVFSPDGRSILTAGGEGNVRLHGRTNAEVFAAGRPETGVTPSAAVSPRR